MDFATVQTALPALLATLLAVPCQYAAQPRRFVVGACAVVDLLGIVPVGMDERVYVRTDDGDSLVETVLGARELTIQVTAWGIDQRLDQSARALLERLRTRLAWTSSVDALSAMGLAVATVQPIVPGDKAQNGRVESQASMDITFNCGVAESDAPAPFIKTARVFSESIRNAAGEPLAMQSDLTLEVPES